MTASEQRLALGLGAVVVIGGAFIGLTKLRAWKQSVDVSSIEMESRRVEADDLMAQKEFWNERFTWLTEKQPLYSNRGEVDNNFLTQLQDSAATRGVQLRVTQPREPAERAGLVSSTFSIEAIASWEVMNLWLHDLQKPDAYISIPSLTMVTNDEDTTMVIVSMNIQKWFRLPNL